MVISTQVGNINIGIKLFANDDEPYCILTFSESKDTITFPKLTYINMVDLYSSLLDSSWYSTEVVENGRKIIYSIYKRLFNLSTNRTTYSFHVNKNELNLSSGVQDGIQHNMVYPIEHDIVRFGEIIKNFSDALFNLKI